MSMPPTIREFLERRHARYELVPHPRGRANRQASRIPTDHIAKAVILRDALGYLMAVLPAGQAVRLKTLRHSLDRAFILSDEREIERLFRDCARGAVPPLGPAYGLDTLVDDALLELADVYFEAGDHEQLVHTDGKSFRALLREALHGRIGTGTGRDPSTGP